MLALNDVDSGMLNDSTSFVRKDAGGSRVRFASMLYDVMSGSFGRCRPAPCKLVWWCVSSGVSNIPSFDSGPADAPINCLCDQCPTSGH
jgi:hypothetical protein